MKRSIKIMIPLLLSLMIISGSCDNDKKSPTGPATYILRGKILENDVGLSGIPVHITGDTTDETIISNDDGNYSLGDISDGIYTVTPSKSDYMFYPLSIRVAIHGADAIAENIIAVKIVPPETTIIEGITLISIPGGSFEMGSDGGDIDEKPIHLVCLDGFEMSKTEITQGQYVEIMDCNPSYVTGDDNLPVERVAWYDAVRFCNKLSTRAGLDCCYDETTWECNFDTSGFRMPSEAEWEYACRAGTDTKYYIGNNESDLFSAGWFDANSDGTSHIVGQKMANAWGLHDMSGNVWEWCNDLYERYYYHKSPLYNPTGSQNGIVVVLRGGCWFSSASICRSTNRGYTFLDHLNIYSGFRIVRRAEPSER